MCVCVCVCKCMFSCVCVCVSMCVLPTIRLPHPRTTRIIHIKYVVTFSICHEMHNCYGMNMKTGEDSGCFKCPWGGGG